MLNNYIFYNMNKFKIELEKIDKIDMNENLLENCIKCYSSFFPKTKVLLTPYQSKLLVIKKNMYY